MGHVTLTSETLRNFAKAVGEIDWAAEGMSFLGQVNSQSRYSSHMPRGAFIDLVRTAMEETLRQTGRYPPSLTEDDLREYSKADRTVVRSGRPFVFGDKKDQRDYRA